LKILILKPSSLGDVVQALPVLRLLKLQFPKAGIYWWIDSALAPLIAGDPDLAGLVLFERKRWGKIRHWPEMFRSIAWLRAQQFDLVIDLQGLLRSGIFAWLANGKFLAGLDENREGARGFYDLAAPRASFHTHAVDWYLSVLPPLGVKVHDRFTWLPPRPEVAAIVKAKWAADKNSWFALQPGARWDNKRWPVEKYSELVRHLAKKFPDTRFAILGSPEDRHLGGAIASTEPERCLNLCGATTLPEMIEWLRLSRLLITNDTGPMHVAAALGLPLVALFGPTEPRRTGPYGQLANVLRIDLPCSPCLKSECHFVKPQECLRALSSEMVVEKTLHVLNGAA
jgi:lipopolysaccharide heptosyltransferase II